MGRLDSEKRTREDEAATTSDFGEPRVFIGDCSGQRPDIYGEQFPLNVMFQFPCLIGLKKEGRRARPRNGVPLRTRLDPNIGSPRHPELFFSFKCCEPPLSFLSATRSDHWLASSSSLATQSGLRCISRSRSLRYSEVDSHPFGRRRNSPRIDFVLLKLREGRRARPRNGVLLLPRLAPVRGTPRSIKPAQLEFQTVWHYSGLLRRQTICGRTL